MTRQRRPPLRITLLLGLVLIITILSAVRLYTALAWRNVLGSYIPTALIYYAAASGAVWTIVGCFVLFSFWRRGRYTRPVLLTASVLYAAWGWVDRLLAQPGEHPNWPFALAGTIILLAFVAVVALDPHHQLYFRKEKYDRKPEYPASA
jgi:membrane associated rhomboid family serine protease